jgi:thiol-disulfide isomerase/thioredoxin
MIALICVLAGCNSNDPPPKIVVPGPPLSGSINTLGWTGDGGKRNVFSDYRGKVLVLDFYATWCVPCRVSIPHLVGLQKKYESQGLQVIGLNVGGPEDLPKVPAFAAEFGIPYPLALPDDDLVMFLMADNDAWSALDRAMRKRSIKPSKLRCKLRLNERQNRQVEF